MAFIESLGRQTISIFHQLGAIILLLIAAVKEIGTIRSRKRLSSACPSVFCHFRLLH